MTNRTFVSVCLTKFDKPGDKDGSYAERAEQATPVTALCRERGELPSSTDV